MPGHDKTGPLGAGPLTGRRMGLCADNENVEHRNIPGGQLRGGNFPGGGRGYGFGRREGSGRGLYGGQRQSFRGGVGFRGSMIDQPNSGESGIAEEINILKNKVKMLEDQLSQFKKSD